MKLIEYFTEVLFPKPKYLTPEREQAIADRFIARNISSDRMCSDSQATASIARTEGLIRSGKYITQKDLDRMREEVLSYSL